MKTIHQESVKNPERFDHSGAVTKEFCTEAIGYILGKIDQNLDAFTHMFPAPTSVENVYPAIGNTDWTASFWTGMLWLAYETTGNEKYRKVAEIHLESFRDRIERKINLDHHDLGFLYTLSSVAAYKLTGDLQARSTALSAADLLMERYFEKAGIIQAWGDLNDPEQLGRMIIDSCMNLPLLYWASRETGDWKYHEAAASHVRQAANYIVREDASTYHTFYMDTETGKPKYGRTHQGYSDTSCWSRGQAWGIYGFPLSYLYTQDPELLELNKKLIHYFLNRLPEDHICYWDLVFVEGGEERDSSAAAIAACGLLETARQLPPADSSKELFKNAAKKIIESLANNYTTKTIPESNGILAHAVYAKPQNNGIDECCIWGDYCYFEALVRLSRDWKPYW